MFSMMRVMFEQQNRTKPGMSLAERRMQLKDQIRKGSMYKSLTSYFQDVSCELLRALTTV